MRILSLFCGCGGLDKGFVNAGYDIVWANDFDKYAIQTYRANFDHPSIEGDIYDVSLDELPDFDVLIGGFPCQPFSMMGAERGFEDARGTLFFRIAEIIQDRINKNKKPKAIILENVRSLKTHDKGRTYKTIKSILENDLGYKVFCDILNTAEYGIAAHWRYKEKGSKKADSANDIKFSWMRKREAINKSKAHILSCLLKQSVVVKCKQF